MKNPVIYADITFLINFGLDFFLLFITSRIAMQKVAFRRILSGAMLGGFYSLGYIYFPKILLFSFGGKIIFSLLMLYVVFRPPDLYSAKSLILTFYVCSLLLAGLYLGIYYIKDGVRIAPWLIFIPALLLLGLLGRELRKHWANLWTQTTRLKVEITFLGRQVNGQGFMDTGNGLIDPFSRQPVIVVEADLWHKLLPEPLVDWHDSLTAGNQLALCEGLAERIRMIPYSSVGKSRGIMLGFRCDEIVVSAQNGSKSSLKGVVAVAPEPLSADGEYQCLVPAGFFTDG